MAAPNRIYELKKTQLFIEFTFSCIHNLNFFERKSHIFSFKIFVFLPILPLPDSDPRGCLSLPPHVRHCTDTRSRMVFIHKEDMHEA
jgi:hypothetical protein